MLRQVEKNKTYEKNDRSTDFTWHSWLSSKPLYRTAKALISHLQYHFADKEMTLKKTENEGSEQAYRLMTSLTSFLSLRFESLIFGVIDHRSWAKSQCIKLDLWEFFGSSHGMSKKWTSDWLANITVKHKKQSFGWARIQQAGDDDLFEIKGECVTHFHGCHAWKPPILNRLPQRARFDYPAAAAHWKTFQPQAIAEIQADWEFCHALRTRLICGKRIAHADDSQFWSDPFGKSRGILPPELSFPSSPRKLTCYRQLGVPFRFSPCERIGASSARVRIHRFQILW